MNPLIEELFYAESHLRNHQLEPTKEWVYQTYQTCIQFDSDLNNKNAYAITLSCYALFGLKGNQKAEKYMVQEEMYESINKVLSMFHALNSGQGTSKYDHTILQAIKRFQGTSRKKTILK